MTLLACIYGEPRTPVQLHLSVQLSCFVLLQQAVGLFITDVREAL